MMKLKLNVIFLDTILIICDKIEHLFPEPVLPTVLIFLYANLAANYLENT